MGFPSRHRLTRDKDVQAVFDEGEFFQGTYCHLLVQPVDEGPFKAAFVVSEKSASLATERNRIKRLMRESLRLRLDELHPRHHVVLLATRQAHGDLKRQDIDRDLEPLLDEAGLRDAGDPADRDPAPPSDDESLPFPHRMVTFLIDRYQCWISPLLGAHCRFRPTCSEYTRQALRKHGFVKGLFLGIIRILRCNPLSSGGYDPVP